MTEPANCKRRQVVLACATGVSAASVAYWWEPLKRKIYTPGNVLTVNIASVQSEQLMTIDWDNKPVWILRRSAMDLASLEGNETSLTDPSSDNSIQPLGCVNRGRSVRPDIFVAIGLCTHQGCTPVLQPGIGFLCPCHASRYDLAGRVFAKGPAPANLAIPPHHFQSPDHLVLGADA